MKASYKIPAHLSNHIDFVYPGVVMAHRKDVQKPKRRASNPKKTSLRSEQDTYISKRQVTANCSDLVTPASIAALYDIPAANKTNLNNSMGIFEKGAWYQDEDLDLFFATYPPEIPQGTRPLNLSIDLAVCHYNESDTFISEPDETDLDLKVAYPLIYPQKTTVFQTDDECMLLHISASSAPSLMPLIV